MKIQLEVSEENEGTSEPWWIIINPRQNFRTNDEGLYAIANMITGPFFSREEAQGHLDRRHYAFSKNARVFCHSGYWATQYKKAIKESENKECLTKTV